MIRCFNFCETIWPADTYFTLASRYLLHSCKFMVIEHFRSVSWFKGLFVHLLRVRMLSWLSLNTKNHVYFQICIVFNIPLSSYSS